MLVELKNGETLNGHLIACDTWMNLTLKEVVQTSPEGDKFFRLSEVYVRGNNVRLGSFCSRIYRYYIFLFIARTKREQYQYHSLIIPAFPLLRSNTSEYQTKSLTWLKTSNQTSQTIAVGEAQVVGREVAVPITDEEREEEEAGRELGWEEEGAGVAEDS